MVKMNVCSVRVVGCWAGFSLSSASETLAVTCSVDFYCAPILLEHQGLVNFKERSSRRPSTIKAESLTAGNIEVRRGEFDNHRFQPSRIWKHQRFKIFQFPVFFLYGKWLLKSSVLICKSHLPKNEVVISSETFFQTTIMLQVMPHTA